ncbi:fibrinogen alpha chain-like [Pelobates fuscus]|uniref:fibrinogen alpha chain-like n=1 Tax=Pelobates fuscus TaxID=191477 RepID=UPI002FE4C61A
MSRVDKTKKSCLTSNTIYLSSLPGIKQLHDAIEENMLNEQVAFRNFAEVGQLLRNRLSALGVKVKEQKMKIENVLSDLKEQMATMKRLEVDISIKLHACGGSCSKVQFYKTNTENYTIWKKHLDEINTKSTIQAKNQSHINLYFIANNVTNYTESPVALNGMQLGLFANIEQYVLKAEKVENNQTNSAV